MSINKKVIPITNGVIYKTTNLITGKIYIGQDSKNDNIYLGSGNLIKKAIKKYGKDNFKKEILWFASSQLELNEKEAFFIETYNSRNKDIGYNIAYGGTNGTMLNRKHSDSTKEKMSLIRMGMEFTESHKLNLSKAKKGKKLSDETKKKLSEIQKLKPHNKLSEETKNKIRISKTGKKASQETREKMSEAHNGINNHFYGKKHSEKTLKIRRKIIIQLTLDNEFIKEWDGVNLAAITLGIRQSAISAVLCGTRLKTNGFKFKYKNDK